MLETKICIDLQKLVARKYTSKYFKQAKKITQNVSLTTKTDTLTAEHAKAIEKYHAIRTHMVIHGYSHISRVNQEFVLLGSQTHLFRMVKYTGYIRRFVQHHIKSESKQANR